MRLTHTLSIFLVFSLSFPASVSAQEVIDLIAAASCECIENLEEGVEFEAATESCVQTAIFSNITPILEEYDFNVTDQDEAERLGEQIGIQVGMKLVSDCPAFMEMMMASEDFIDEIEDYEEVAPDNSETLRGTFLGEKVTKGGFSYLVIEDEYGDEVELLWLNPFAGDERIGEDLEGSRVTVRWKPAYIRNGKEGEYLKTKVISALEQ